MTDLISVIIPTYNPDPSRFHQTLSGLKHQTLLLERWELIIVDNNSSNQVTVTPNWHPNFLIVKQPLPGLTHARLKGFAHAKGDIIIMVDDDNILDANYLKNTLAIFNSNNTLGAIGGKSVPLFEVAPPLWLKEFYGNLALRDLGNEILTSSWKNEYPLCAPIGAGMCIRKAALDAYIKKSKSENNYIGDRTGGALTSGGDNDIVLDILQSGWQVGYYPSLLLEHIIPAARMHVAYLAKLVNNTNRSWIQVLQKHHINPWKKISVYTKPLRKIKAWFVYKAWQNKVNYIKWQGACGMFDGLSAI